MPNGIAAALAAGLTLLGVGILDKRYSDDDHPVVWILLGAVDLLTVGVMYIGKWLL